MPASIQFYHLTSSPLERALPKLVEKAYSAGLRVHLLLEAEARVEYFNQALWTYDPDSFLPHGSCQDASPEKQPVYLSTGFDAPNAPDVLLVADGRVPEASDNYERILDIFDGKDTSAMENARARWKQYKEQGLEVSYYSQNDKGRWEKKAA